MGRGSTLVLAVSGVAVCGALATGPGLAVAAASATERMATSVATPGWRSAQQVPGVAALAPDDGAGSWALSCSSPGNCSVGGTYGDRNSADSSAFVAGQRDGTWGKAIQLPGIGALNAGKQAGVMALSCTSPGDCAAGGAYSPNDGTDAGGQNPALNAFVAAEKGGTWGKASQIPGLAALNAGFSAIVSSLSCTSPGNCTAAGEYAPGGAAGGGGENAITSGFVATEKSGIWGRALEIPGLGALNTGGQVLVNSISCVPGGNCAVGGDYTTVSGPVQAFVADESGGSWQQAEEFPGTGDLNTDGQAGVSSVSCASPGNCGALGYYSSGSGGTFLASEINGTWGTADALPDGVNAASISCPPAGNCVAAGNDGLGDQGSQAFVMTERSGTWGSPQPVPGLTGMNIGQNAGINSLSCPAPGDCGAAGYYAGKKSDENQDQVFVVTETGGSWGRAEQIPGISALTATDMADVSIVSCASPLACAATGSYGTGGVFVVSTGTPTATAESLSAVKVTYGREQAERVSVSVIAKRGGPPAGKVTVRAGSATLCVITLHSGRGTCRLTARRLGRGTYHLTAAYPGTGVFISSVSHVKTLTVVG
jgi:hypothetical protein